MLLFFKTIPSVLKRIYTWPLVACQIVACVITYLLVQSGFDWKYFVYMQTFSYAPFFRLALAGGFILPILLPFLVIFVEAVRKKYAQEEYGWMILQAAFLGWAVSSVYKTFTGRIQPDRHNLLLDISHNFNFGILKHGIFWGWPSSHTSVAFAIAGAVMVTTRRTWWKVVVFLLALYVGIGVSFSVHWFSEFVAGAIIGLVIGISVGNVWKKLL